MTTSHYCMSHRAYSPNLENFVSLFYMFRAVHSTERRAFHLEILVTAPLRNALPSAFA